MMKETAAAVLFMALLLMVVVGATTQRASTCSNDDACVLSCEDCTDGEKVHDPSDCHNYYMCEDGQAEPDLPLMCPDGQHFDYTAHQCVSGDECDIICSTSPADCHYQCQEDVFTFPSHAHQFDCSSYYICNGGDDGQLFTCPSEAPYFDGTTCQTDINQCCSCLPYCGAGDMGTMVMDPSDCTKYYYCFALGFPEDFGQCPDGEYFDPMGQDCSDNVPCSTVPSCYNTVNPDGCIDSYTCQEFGVVAMCPNLCIDEFYYCTTADIGHTVEPSTCQYNYVFNPENNQCVPVEDCPFPPSIIRITE